MEEMEKVLDLWIQHQNSRSCPVSGSIIQEKALQIWNQLKQQAAERPSTSTESSTTEESFVASNGWLDKFRKRYNLHSIKKSGEAASADNEAAIKFIIKLRNIIEEGKYLPQQVFNFDETGLNWKKLPNKTYISRSESSSPGFKVSKERLTVVFGANATGDFKFKPCVIGRSENPRALKGVSKSTLPVLYKSNMKAWMTSKLCTDYMTNYIIGAIKEYNRSHNLDNKALLLLDNAPGHPLSLQNICEHVKVVFLPPNTTSLIQPMDQGVIAAFKAQYLKKVMQFIIKESDKNKDLSLIEVWKKYDIKQSIEDIATCWNLLKVTNLNAAWLKVWPEVINRTPEEGNINSITSEIISMENDVGIEGFDEEGVNVILNGGEEISVEEIQQLLKEQETETTDDYD